MTNRSVVPSDHRRPTATRTASRHRAPAGQAEVRRQRALVGTLLAVALALLALALPSAAGAIGGAAPSALGTAEPAQHAQHAPARSSAAASLSSAAAPGSATSAASSPPPSTAAAPAASSPAPVAVAHASHPATTTPAPVAAGAPAPTATGAEGEVLALVNQQRATSGCPALRADDALATLARAHSADMRDRGYFSHDTPEGLSPFDRADAAGISTMRAENIAMGQATPAAVMTAWMNSPGHRANILDCSLRALGVGVAYGSGGPWWTQDFGI